MIFKGRVFIVMVVSLLKQNRPKMKLLSKTKLLIYRRTLLVYAFFLSGFISQGQPPHDQWPKVGMNMEWQELMKWTTSIPFNNLFKVADPFSGASSYDEDGYPLTGLPASSQVYIGEALPTGVFKIRWDGDGAFTIIVDGNSHHFEGICPEDGEELLIDNTLASISVEITATSASGHLHNMRMYLPGYDDNSPHQFNDCYLSIYASPIDVIRPMWWAMVPGSDIVDWEDRPTLSDYTYGGDDDNVVNHGAAYEHMIDICNVTNSDLWICVPVQASDDYVSQLAALIKDRLNESLNVFVEYSNESIWNYWYEYHNSVDVADVGLSGYNGDDGDIYVSHKFGARTVQILELFDNVFAADSNRLIGVVGCQFSYYAPMEYMVDAINWLGKMHLVDAFAIAPYVGESRFITTNWPDMDAVFDGLDQFALDLMSGDARPGPLNDLGDPITDFIDLSNRYNKKLVCYEAGQHFTAWHGGISEEQVVAVNDHPRMHDWYMHYLDGWFNNGDVASTMVFYTSTSGCPSGGSCFGTMHSCAQPLDEAHKYRGILDWFNTGTDTQAPTVPLHLMVNNVTQNSCVLFWSASRDNVKVSEYEVYQDGVLIGTTSNTTFVVDNLSPGMTYEFTVRALDAANNSSDMSDAVTVLTSGTVTGSGALSLQNVRLYPNPVGEGIINIYTGEATTTNVSIYNLRGELLHHNEGAHGAIKVNVSALLSGVYIIKLSNTANTRFFKVLVTN